MRLLLNNCIELTLDEALQLLGGYGREAAAYAGHSVVSMVTIPSLRSSICSTYTPRLLAGGEVLASLYRLVRMGAARQAMRRTERAAPVKQAPKQAPARAKLAPAKQVPAKQTKSQVTRRPTICGSGKRRMKKSHG